MPKIVLLLAILILFGAGGFYLYKNHLPQSVPIAVVSPPTPPQKIDTCEVLIKGNGQIPPLYKDGITWGIASPSAQEVTGFKDISLGQGFYSKTVNGCLIQGTATWDNASKMESFYMHALEKYSWKMVDTGDMPYGSFLVYKKGSEYFLIRLDSTNIKLFHSY